MNISKSKYCDFRVCPKSMWLRQHKPELNEISLDAKSRAEAGKEIGNMAKGLFGDYADVTITNPDRSPDFSVMLLKTQELLAKDTPVICEASFSINGLFCSVDILRKTDEGWEIYEVKSSTDPNKDTYIVDVAFQKYVLDAAGIPITGCYLITVNSKYVFDGTMDISQFFTITDMNDVIKEEYDMIEVLLPRTLATLESSQEPDIDLFDSCKGCDFWSNCARSLPSPSVFDLYRMSFKNKLELYRKGLISYEDLLKSGKVTNPIRVMQLMHQLNDCPDQIDVQKITEFLDTLSYPLYFLDFETMQPAIPRYAGTRPYQQVPFQYSLHYIEGEGMPLEHKEFLAESGIDPRRSLAKQLCIDIPQNVCTLAYNKKFECDRIKELAAAFPDLSVHLLNIRDNIVDLLTPFQSGYYYNRAMGGSFSIKSVLPALFPDDPELDYHNLDGVHNGSEAMNIFPQIQFMPPEEQAKARHNLLKYCELDTYAMVKVWEKLISSSASHAVLPVCP